MEDGLHSEELTQAIRLANSSVVEAPGAPPAAVKAADNRKKHKAAVVESPAASAAMEMLAFPPAYFAAPETAAGTAAEISAAVTGTTVGSWRFQNFVFIWRPKCMEHFRRF